MALSDAILDIANQMEEEAKSDEVDYERETRKVLLSYARQLRSTVKAAEGTSQGVGGGIPLIIPRQPDPNEVLIKHAQREMEQRTMLQEKAGSAMVMIEGGDGDGTMIEVDPNMPVTARMPIGNEVYIFTPERKLQFSPEETEKYRKQRGM